LKRKGLRKYRKPVASRNAKRFLLKSNYWLYILVYDLMANKNVGIIEVAFLNLICNINVTIL
jgi:hypothetical protein